MPILRDGTSTTDFRLDRLVHFDPRSLAYAILDFLDPSLHSAQTRMWDLPGGQPVLDQGRQGACVGYGVTNELRFNPVPVPNLDGAFAVHDIYWPAQYHDPFPGGDYPGANPLSQGTTVLAGVGAARTLGFYGGFRWALGERQLAIAVSRAGPVVLGVTWSTDMFTPDAQGFITPTGDPAGGHCILCVGVDIENDYYTLYNSWGPDWGLGGTCRVRRAAMSTLLRDQGEAVVPVNRSLTPSRPLI